MTPTRGRRDGRAVRILAFAAAISLYGIRRADVQTTSARKDYGGRWLRHDRWDDDDGGEYEVVTTDYGWNSPTVSPPTRRILTGEFYRAILEHPRYNATAWSDLHEHPDPSRRVVAFMDVDTCMESNYPTYGVKWTHDNVNLEINAIPGERIQRSLRYACGHVRRAFESPALSANPDSRLVILDCGTGYPARGSKICATTRRTPTLTRSSVGAGSETGEIRCRAPSLSSRTTASRKTKRGRRTSACLPRPSSRSSWACTNGTPWRTARGS